MKYLLLWSGYVPGMKKAVIPALENKRGICGHYIGEKIYVPCAESIRAALPYKFRAAFDRSGGVLWFDKRGADYPASVTLCYAKSGRDMVTLYLQPLTKGHS